MINPVYKDNIDIALMSNTLLRKTLHLLFNFQWDNIMELYLFKYNLEVMPPSRKSLIWF